MKKHEKNTRKHEYSVKALFGAKNGKVSAMRKKKC